MEPTRSLTLLDGMIVIAATACGFAAIRGAVPEMLHMLPTGPRVPFFMSRPVLGFALVTLAAWPLPAMWSIALLIMRLRRPRPRWRRLSRQPGVTASCAVAFASTFNAVLLTALSLKIRAFSNFLLITALPVGLAVAVAWGMLLLTVQWRPVTDEFDRVGRLFGAYWLAMVPLSVLVAVTLIR